MGDERVDIFMLVRVDHKARALIDQEKVLILIDNIQLGLKDGQKGVFRRRGVKKLIIDIECKQVSRIQACIPLGSLSIELHSFETNVFLSEWSGEERNSLAQPAVQPLSGVIFSNGEFFQKTGGPPQS